MKVLSDSMQGDIVRRGGPDRVQQQVQVIFHVLSVLLAAQYSCTKGLGADSAVSNAICDPQVRAAMQRGVQLLISALDHHHHSIDGDGHHIADQRVMLFNKDSEGRRLVGLCSLMLQVRTVGWMLPSMLGLVTASLLLVSCTELLDGSSSCAEQRSLGCRLEAAVPPLQAPVQHLATDHGT